MGITEFPRGRLILEAQSIILKTLRGTVEYLLLGIDTENSSSKWHILVDNNFHGAAGSTAWSNFSDQAFTAPIFDLDRLLNISRATFHEAGDHLWLLQTDPVYLQYHARLARQVWSSKGTGDRFFHKSAWVLRYKAFTTVQRWSWVVDEFEHAQAQRHKFWDNINCELLLINLLLQRVKKLRNCLPSFKGFSQDYKISDTGDTVTAQLNAGKYSTGKAIFYHDPLNWCLIQMTADPEDPNNHDASMLLGFLTDWLNKDTTMADDKQRIDPQILEVLSEYATHYELLAAVRQHRTLLRAINMDTARVEGRERLAWRGIPDEETEQGIKHLAELLETIRYNTSALWALVWIIHGDILKKHKFSTEKDYGHDLAMLSYDGTPEHLLALKLQREAIIQLKNPVQQAIAVDKTWDLTHATKGLSALDVSVRLKERIKKKAEQQTPNQIVAPSVRNKEGSAPANSHRTVHIKSSSLPILSHLFPNTVYEYAAKPLDRRTFVTAMDDAEFTSTESGGSAVTFPITDNGGSIVFQKPHPTAKVEQFMLQGWEKRLEKWFGWTIESLVVT
ncbi:hypothetical protein ACHAQE_002712 [Botrytis cinerea]